jgi:hypothetical protein
LFVSSAAVLPLFFVRFPHTKGGGFDDDWTPFFCFFFLFLSFPVFGWFAVCVHFRAKQAFGGLVLRALDDDAKKTRCRQWQTAAKANFQQRHRFFFARFSFRFFRVAEKCVIY